MGPKGAILRFWLQLPAVLHDKRSWGCPLNSVRGGMRLAGSGIKIPPIKRQLLYYRLCLTSSVAGMSTWTTVLCGAMVSLAGVGRARRWLMVLLPGLLPTLYTLILPSSIHPTARTIVGTVSPSAYFVAVRCRSFIRKNRHCNAVAIRYWVALFINHFNLYSQKIKEKSTAIWNFVPNSVLINNDRIVF